MKERIKRFITRLLCRHEYYYVSEWVTTSKSIDGIKTNATSKHEIICACRKCGKEKKYNFFKITLDK